MRNTNKTETFVMIRRRAALGLVSAWFWSRSISAHPGSPSLSLALSRPLSPTTRHGNKFGARVSPADHRLALAAALSTMGRECARVI